jgi:hypothetical protein
MVHIGDVLLKDGKPTGELKALCGASVTKVLDAGAAKDVCVVCSELSKR